MRARRLKFVKEYRRKHGKPPKRTVWIRAKKAASPRLYTIADIAMAIGNGPIFDTMDFLSDRNSAFDDSDWVEAVK